MESRLTISRLAQVFDFGEPKTPGRCLVECMVRGDARCRVEIETPLSDREGRANHRSTGFGGERVGCED